VLDYLLFALAWLGHACISMVLVNLVYSHPWHKTLLKIFRATMGLLIFAGPPAFAWFVGYRVLDIFESAASTPGRLAETTYLGLALFTSCVALPVVTLRRCTRPLPRCVLGESTRTIDVAKELGELPFGDGEGAHAAHLPFNNIFNVDFTTLTVALPALPAACDGLTLLQISDLHFFGTPSQRFFDFVMQHCMSEGVPDLVLITGDVVDSDTHYQWIRPVLGQLRWNLGAYAVLGNHDWWQDFEQVRKSLSEIGVRSLGNRWEQVEARGAKLTLIGHEGPWFRPAPDLSACPADGLRILLSHTPDNIRWAQRNNVTLMLSGHNHGGQVRLPLFGSIFVPSKFSRRYDMGTFFEPPTLLHVNRGLSGKEPLRFRCNPQVTRFVLRCAPENAGG